MTNAPSTADKRSDSHITGNLKYLIFEDRIYIENKLNKGSSFKYIAKFLYKDATCTSKEVKAHRLCDRYHINLNNLYENSANNYLTVTDKRLFPISPAASGNLISTINSSFSIFASICPFNRLTSSLAIDSPNPVDVLLLAASAL